jgi:hypothetical protein
MALSPQGWGCPSDLPSRDVLTQLYLFNPRLRLKSAPIVEAPLDPVADFPETAVHEARETMINADAPPSDTNSPHDGGTNIHGGTFVGGNANIFQRSGESGAFISPEH